MILKSRKAKIIAGITAAAVLTTVLLLINIGAAGDNGVPDTRVLVLVNGAEVTEADVYRKQTEHYLTYGQDLNDEDALELLIVRMAVYQEAEKRGYKPTGLEAERRLLTEWGLTLDQLKAQLEMDGRCYEEFLEQARVNIAFEDFSYALYEAIEVTEEEARAFYEEMKEAGEDLEPFDEMKERLVVFLTYEEWLEQIAEIVDNAEVEFL